MRHDGLVEQVPQVIPVLGRVPIEPLVERVRQGLQKGAVVSQEPLVPVSLARQVYVHCDPLAAHLIGLDDVLPDSGLGQTDG